MNTVRALMVLCVSFSAYADESALSAKVHALCDRPDQVLGQSIAQVEQHLGRASQIAEDVVANAYDERIKDRRLTLIYPKTKVTLFVANLMGKHWLESITTEDNLPLFSDMVQIGQSVASLKKALGVPTSESKAQLAYWCDEEYGQGIVFITANDKIKSLAWRGGSD